MSTEKRPFWVSWWYAGAFELHSPWWESGWRMLDGEDQDQASIVAAVMATDEEDAKRVILDAHDDEGEGWKPDIEWRFVNAREPGWAPFCERFPRADWMQWAS